MPPSERVNTSDGEDGEVPAGFFCPVCGRDTDRLWVWQVLGGDRARIYCETCAADPAYAETSAGEPRLLEQAAFEAWAGRRLLLRVHLKEQARRA